LSWVVLGAVWAQTPRACADADLPRHACCCTGHAQPAAQRQLASDCCCELQAQRTAAVPLATAASPVPAAAASAVADLQSLAPRAQERRVAPRAQRAAPGHGPPLFIQNRALLI
jgi:hypothetical protein